MSKRSQINFGGVTKNTTLTGSVALQSIAPNGEVKNYSYPNQTFSSHKAIGKSPARGKPSTYIMHAAVTRRHQMDYKTSSHPLAYRYVGTSDTSRGIGTSSYTYYGLTLSGSSWVPDIPGSLLTQAITEAKLKLNSEFNLGATLGEAVDSLSTISGLLTSCAELLARYMRNSKKKYAKSPKKVPSDWMKDFWPNASAIERRNYLRARQRGFYHFLRPPPLTSGFGGKADRFANHAEKSWLSYQYALLPLVSGINAACARYGEALQKEGAHISVYRGLNRSRALPSYEPGRPYFKAEGFSKYGAECELNYRVDSPQLYQMAQIGMTNPLQVFWEVTPFSFVFDWLVPVGNMLNALTADHGLVFLSGYTNKKSFTKMDVSGCMHANYVGKPPRVTYQNVAQLRTALFSSPVTGLYFKSPFSATHATSAIALVAQLMRR